MLPKLIIGIIILIFVTAIGILVTKPQKSVPLPILTSLQELTVSTDRAIYNPGGPISIKVRNSLKQSIYLHKSELGIEFLEKKKGEGTWEQLAVGCKYPDCIYDTDSPSEIKPGEEAVFAWEPKKAQISTGIYRLNISYQEREGSNTQDWNWHTIQSNEFTIK